MAAGSAPSSHCSSRSSTAAAWSTVVGRRIARTGGDRQRCEPGPVGVSGVGGAHRPNPSHAAVPGCAECVSSARPARRARRRRRGGRTIASQVVLGEPARPRRRPRARRPRSARPARAANSTARGHLRPHPARARGGRLDQPRFARRHRWRGTRPPPRCVGLGVGGRGWSPAGSGVAGVVRVDPRPPGVDSAWRATSTSPAGGAGAHDGRDRQAVQVGDDDQLLADGADHTSAPTMPGRGGVAHRPEPDRLIVVDQPVLTRARRRAASSRQHVQPLPFDRQPLDRGRAGLPMHAGR